MFYSSLSGMGLATNRGQAEYDLNDTRAEAEETRSEADLLKHDVDRLFMITESLWTLMKKEHGYSDDDLVKSINAIDLRHSGADKDAQEKCPSCGRLISAHRRLCLYCGNPVPRGLFERNPG
jgi:ribosomal protein L32